jgi:hypothetical protein
LCTLSDAPGVISQLKERFEGDLNVLLYKIKFDEETPLFKKNILASLNDEVKYTYCNCDNKLSNYLFNITKKKFITNTFTDMDIKEILTDNISYRGMIVSNNEDAISSMSNVVKALLPRFKDKRVLIITENETKSKELESLLPKNDRVYIEPDNSISKLQQANTKYDVVIEYLFKDEARTHSLRGLVDNSNLNGIYIVLFNNSRLIDINEINLYNYFQIKIINLLSDKVLFPEEKWENTKAPQRIINLYNEAKTEPEDKNFLNFYEKIKSNDLLLKQICYIFYKQNYSKLIFQGVENISLLTGEPGYRTFLASCISSKQKEE